MLCYPVHAPKRCALLNASGVRRHKQFLALRHGAAGEAPNLGWVRIYPLTANFICVLIEIENMQLVLVSEHKRGDQEPVAIGIALERSEAACLVVELVGGI